MATTTPTTPLESWETWPLWALGLSNGLNIALWYVLSMLNINAPDLALRLPAGVNAVLPLVIVAGGIAAAMSLDGVLIATLAGVRGGRAGWWSWGTIVGAGAFSALIAYAVHSGVYTAWAWLHMAQAAVLVLYNLHLSQPKRPYSDDQKPVGMQHKAIEGIDVGNDVLISPDDFACKKCGERGFLTATEVRKHQKAGCVHRAVTGLTQRITPTGTESVNDSAGA